MPTRTLSAQAPIVLVPVLEVEPYRYSDTPMPRETLEYPNPSRTLIEASMLVGWLRAALQAAQVEQARFRDELVPMVSRIFDSPARAHAVANRLSGLD